jgi:hypothetical protein
MHSKLDSGMAALLEFDAMLVIRQVVLLLLLLVVVGDAAVGACRK